MGILSAVLLDMLQEQFRHETSNALRYVARSSWARMRGLEATADFFSREAKGEYEHADKIRQIIEDRNCALMPEPYSYADSSAFSRFNDLFASAMEVERGTTARLTMIAQAALNDGDLMLFGAIQPMIAEQVEEENLYQTILDRIAARGDDAASVHDVDVWIGETFSA